MLDHTYTPENIFWSEKRGVVNASESTTEPGWIHYSGEFTMGYAAKEIFDKEFKPIRVQSQVETCAHHIVDARNPVVKSGYICVKCGAVFAGIHNEDKPGLSAEEFDALDTALNVLLHRQALNAPAKRAIPHIRTMLLNTDPTYQDPPC